ncbi:ABC transporter substrate-binding protein [Thermosipho sp. 1063]|uniref:substrate-binding periplasmic protein n=1 Tax=unclassified Thermosipho (in: thermotogales) TaxID=2676525 RepID=UPI00094946A7|nr:MULTISPECIES: transporter substrate-binding domain-containing protein [unclassified Thermosipho (in: thermotogales)]ANQ53973.1 ABC transporter substrate-binding protein [Thermosipho sp. 1070]APT72418.1 ABC transporter substrate-binding protein [Thermosipho sp. 1063]
MKKLIVVFLLIYTIFYSITLYTYPQDTIAKFLDKDGNLNGISCKIIEILNKKLSNYNIEIEFKSNAPKSLSEILSSLENNEIQIFVGLSKTQERIKKFKFTTFPLWNTKLLIISKKEKTLTEKNKKIGLINSSKTKTLFQNIFPNLAIKSYENIQLAIKDLLNEEIDYVAYNGGILNYYTKIYSLKIIPFESERYRQYIAFSKNVDNQIVNIINNAIKELYNSHEYNNIFKDFSGFSPGNNVYFALIDWPPYEYKENGEWKGIDYELLKVSLENLGFKLVTKKYPWQRCLNLIKSKAIDGTLTLRNTEERSKYIYFTKIPISYGIDVIFSIKNNKEKKILGYVKGYAYNEKIFKMGYKLVSVNNDFNGMLLLSKKRIDLFVSNLYVGLFYAKELNIDVEYSIPIDYFKYYVGFSKSYLGKFLSEKISGVLLKFRKDGTYEKIYQKYNLIFQEDKNGK